MKGKKVLISPCGEKGSNVQGKHRRGRGLSVSVYMLVYEDFLRRPNIKNKGNMRAANKEKNIIANRQK